MLTSLLSVVLDPDPTPLLIDNGVFVKPEGQQKSGSVKYRMVYSKFQKAMRHGQIQDNTTLIEVTSGSTGVALAYLGAQLGLPVELHVYENASVEKINKIRDYGAQVVAHPINEPFPDILEHVVRKSSQGGYWHLNQMDRQSNFLAYTTLAQELISQIHAIRLPLPRYFVCPVGTGGVIQGVGRQLREHFPEIEIVAVEPAQGEHLDGTRNTQQLHLGSQDSYDRDFPDRRIEVASAAQNIEVQGYRLGDSATATWLAIQEYGWQDCLMVGAD